MALKISSGRGRYASSRRQAAACFVNRLINQYSTVYDGGSPLHRAAPRLPNVFIPLHAGIAAAAGGRAIRGRRTFHSGGRRDL